MMIMEVYGDEEAAERAGAALGALGARPGRLERMVDGWLMEPRDGVHQPPINHQPPEPNRCPA